LCTPIAHAEHLLYVAVLEQTHCRMRAIESALHLDDLPPEGALRKPAGFMVDRPPAKLGARDGDA
jgi:hypothetical protein